MVRQQSLVSERHNCLAGEESSCGPSYWHCWGNGHRMCPLYAALPCAMRHDCISQGREPFPGAQASPFTTGWATKSICACLEVPILYMLKMLESGRGCHSCRYLHWVPERLGTPYTATPCSSKEPCARADGHGRALCQRLCSAGCFGRRGSLAHVVPADLSPICVFWSLHR